MKSKLKIIAALALLVPSYNAFADFSLPGKGSVTYPTGVVKEFKFGFDFISYLFYCNNDLRLK